jgi:hypothetical protein
VSFPFEILDDTADGKDAFSRITLKNGTSRLVA